MLTCNVSNVSSILFNHTSSHDSHTEVHQPASISNSTTSHHTSPGHHLYEGDLVSKTSNLNEFSISSNWDLGLGFSVGGAKKKKLVAQSHEQFFFSSPPPLPGRSPAGPVAGDWGLIEIGGLGDKIPLIEVMIWWYMMWCPELADRWYLMDFCVGIMRASS